MFPIVSQCNHLNATTVSVLDSISFPVGVGDGLEVETGRIKLPSSTGKSITVSQNGLFVDGLAFSKISNQVLRQHHSPSGCQQPRDRGRRGIQRLGQMKRSKKEVATRCDKHRASEAPQCRKSRAAQPGEFVN
jgi:hypothetical protein